MTTLLHAYLQQPKPQRFARGVWDCCSFVAGWMGEVMGKPVESAFLGKRLTDRQAAKIVLSAGGLLALAERILSNNGWSVCEDSPLDGAVCIAWAGGCFDNALVGVWSAGRIVTVEHTGALRFFEPSQVTNLKFFYYGR